jgi:hypothetical protein
VKEEYEHNPKKQFCELLRLGFSIPIACGMIGVSPQVYVRTLRTDPEFSREVREIQGASRSAARAVRRLRGR